MKRTFRQRVYEIAFGNNAHNRDFSEDEVIAKLLEYSETSFKIEEIPDEIRDSILEEEGQHEQDMRDDMD